jgi:hypothetical protein
LIFILQKKTQEDNSTKDGQVEEACVDNVLLINLGRKPAVRDKASLSGLKKASWCMF